MPLKKIRIEDIETKAVSTVEIDDFTIEIQDLNQTDPNNSVTGENIQITHNNNTKIKEYIDRWIVEDQSGNLPNTTYTLANTPIPNTLFVFLNGLLQTDYSLVGNQVTLNFTPFSDDISIVFQYRY